MSSEDDFRFLVKLVHHGHLEREQAEPLLARLKDGVALPELLLSSARICTKQSARSK